MNDPRSRQSRFNAESFDQWGGFEGHRRRVSDLLAGGSGRLCVLGAGNANDLDLARLLDSYREVHLVDLDASALARGSERQGVAGRPTLVRHGNLDVTGLLDSIARWSPLGPVAGADLEALVAWPSARVGLALPGPFDVVASTCLLSQLIANAHHAIGEAHPQFGTVIHALRLGHLRLMARLVRPGGSVVLITDLSSTDRVPGLGKIPESSLPSLLSRLVAEGGLIHGVNPVELADLLRRDPFLAPGRFDVTWLPPWRWRLHARTYLVCGLIAKGRGSFLPQPARSPRSPRPEPGRIPRWLHQETDLNVTARSECIEEGRADVAPSGRIGFESSKEGPCRTGFDFSPPDHRPNPKGGSNLSVTRAAGCEPAPAGLCSRPGDAAGDDARG